MNVEFLATAYIIGKSVDYIVQGQKSAERKSKDIRVLSNHSFIYSALTTGLVSIILNITDFLSILVIFWVLLLSHILIDSRTIVKVIMYMKGINDNEMDTKYGWLQISIDQRLHELVILFLALVI